MFCVVLRRVVASGVCEDMCVVCAVCLVMRCVIVCRVVRVALCCVV